MGVWKVLIPTERENFVLNPVFENANNYSAIGAPTIVRSEMGGYCYYGHYYLNISCDTDNEGIRIDIKTLSNAIHYVTVRCSNPDLTGRWDWSIDNTNYYEPTLIGEEGGYKVYGYQFLAAQCSGSQSLRILQKGSTGFTMNLAHIQVEASTTPTTPITGDRPGFADYGYYWTGQPNASSSVRSLYERSGGTEVDLLTSYNFKVLYGKGSGMPPVAHKVQPLAILPGALYQGHKALPRVLDLASGTMATTPEEVARSRAQFIRAIMPNLVYPEQPVVFRYYGTNSTRPVEFYCIYDSGLEFSIDSGVTDFPVVRFLGYDPFCYELYTHSSGLTCYETVSSAGYIVKRINGIWSNVYTSFNGLVQDIIKAPDAKLVMIGAFTDVGGTSGDYIIKYDPNMGTCSALGTGLNGAGLCLALATNGYIYAGGSFTLAGGVANTVRIAYWSGSAWNPLSTGIGSGAVNALAFDTAGNLIVGGTFTNHFDANGDYITKWSGTAFSSLGTGMNGAVNALLALPDGTVVVGGAFTTGNGVTLNGIGIWNGTTFVAMGAGVTGGSATVNTLALDKAGNIIIGGSFTTADGVSCSNIAKWNGVTFEPLGTGVTGGGVNKISIDRLGNFYIGGTFTAAGGITLNDRLTMWNGSTYCHVPIDLPGTPTVYPFCFGKDEIYLGYSTSGTVTGSSRTDTVYNPGSANTYPKFIFVRTGGTSGKLEYIRNVSTGATIYLNYNLAIDEYLYIDLTPGKKTIYSSISGDKWSAMLRASDFTNFFLQPGYNYIELFFTSSGSSYIDAWMEYRVPHWSADTVKA